MHGPRRSGSLALVAALTAAAILAGCGGGSGTTTSAQLSKADFLAKGDEICTQAHDQFTQAQQNPPNDPAGAAELQQKLIDISQHELEEIQSLSVPPELKPALGRYLKAREQGIALLKKGMQAAQNEDAQTYAAANAQLAAGQVHRLQLAQAVGFSQCSRPTGQGSASGQ
jgi:hypothetical protein